MMKILFAILMAVVPATQVLAQTFVFNDPNDDRWHYPFNGTPGTRVTGACFGSTGTGVPSFQNFNDRDGMLVIGWNTGALIDPNQGPAAYNIESITVTLTNESTASWQVDLTPDEWFTFDLDNDTFVNADGVPRGDPGDTDGESDDPDPGRPLELFGAGFGPFYTLQNWVETSAYVGANHLANAPRDPFPFVYQGGTLEMLHVEDHVKGFHNNDINQPVFSFTPQPWSVGVPIGYNPQDPNNQTPFEVVFDVDLTLSAGAVKRSFQQQLDAGRVVVVVTSMIETIQGGTPGGVPSFFFKEGIGLEPGAQAPRLTIVLSGPAQPGDVNGDGCVSLTDLAIVLANFGLPAGAARSDGDLDGDGDVDLSDLAEILANFGAGVC